VLVAASSLWGQLSLSEVQPDPAGDDEQREWIELTNIGTGSVSVAGFGLADFVGGDDPARESPVRWRFPAGTVLAAGEVAVVARSSAGFLALFGRTASFEWAPPADDPAIPNLEPFDTGGLARTSPISLANGASGDALALYDPAGRLVDAVEWGSLDRAVRGRPLVAGPRTGESLVRVASTADSAVDFAVADPPTPFVGYRPRALSILSYSLRPQHLDATEGIVVSATVAGPVERVELLVALASAIGADAHAAYAAHPLAPAGAASFAARLDPAVLGLAPVTRFHERYLRFFLRASAGPEVLTSPAGADATPANPSYRWRNLVPAGPTPIEDARAADAAGALRFPAHSVRVRGAALSAGDRANPSASMFSIAARGAAIFVYEPVPGAWALRPGDRVEVVGRLEQFRGLAQLAGPGLSVSVLGPGEPVRPLDLDVAALLRDAEAHEGRLVRLSAVRFLQPVAAWSAACFGGGCDYDVEDGTGVLALRVWAGARLEGPAPPGAFTVVGVLAQFAASDRALGGYQLWPRGPEDLAVAAPPVDAAVTLDAAPKLDAGIELDAAASEDASAEVPLPVAEDCGCRGAGRGGPSLALIGLFGAALGTLRRARPRSTAS